MKKHHFRSVFTIIILLLAGCASSPEVQKQEAVFYPEAPELPRLQYLTSFTSSRDVTQKKSYFDQFVTGSKDVITRLDKPYGVAIYDGKIYVCDTNQTVMVFDLNKQTFGPLQGAQGLGKLVQPINISIDKDGNKYVSDAIRQQVVVFDKNDFYVKAYGTAGEWRPADAVVYEDKLYVADSKNSEVRVYALDSGELLQRFGSQGELKDHLAIPTNLAFDNEGMLYVSDSGRFQIVKFDRDGNLRGTIGSLGSQLGFFSRPRGIALDRENLLYVVDAAFDNVQIFTKEGQLLMFFGKSGNKPGDLYLPAKVTVDYKNIAYFQRYADPKFEISAIVLVSSQFGARMVNVYALGMEKGKTYPTLEELRNLAEENLKKKQENKEKKPDDSENKEEKKE